MSRVVLVDDHPVFRRGLSVLLAASGIDVVGEAASGSEALAAVARLLPDIVLMDLGLPELGGIAATERIVAEHPQIRVVVITMHDDPESARAALSAGAIGYVVKDAPPEEILAAIRAAELGASMLGAGLRAGLMGGAGRVGGPGGAGGMGAVGGGVGAGGRGGEGSAHTGAGHEADAFSDFTPREREVAALLARGLSNRAIGGRLGVSAKTVANYVANVRLKLGASDRYEAATLIRARS